jgi:hypothetical protein
MLYIYHLLLKTVRNFHWYWYIGLAPTTMLVKFKPWISISKVARF